MVKTRKEAKVGIEKEPDRLYFVDKDGDISSCLMNRNGKKRRKY